MCSAGQLNCVPHARMGAVERVGRCEEDHTRRLYQMVGKNGLIFTARDGHALAHVTVAGDDPLVGRQIARPIGRGRGACRC
jgi:hypothetical protein